MNWKLNWWYSKWLRIISLDGTGRKKCANDCTRNLVLPLNWALEGLWSNFSSWHFRAHGNLNWCERVKILYTKIHLQNRFNLLTVATVLFQMFIQAHGMASAFFLAKIFLVLKLVNFSYFSHSQWTRWKINQRQFQGLIKQNRRINVWRSPTCFRVIVWFFP